VVGTERGGSGGGHPGEVATGLVPVAQLLGDRAQVKRDRQEQRVSVAPPAQPGGERLLQNPSGGCRIVGLHV
jgi:hypothetical protein